MSLIYGQTYGQLANRVPANPKCNTCLHYNNIQSVCTVGTNPSICGNGASPSMGFAPIDATGPDSTFDETPSHAVASRAPVQGSTPDVKMAIAHLGDMSELIALSQQVVGDLKKSCRQGCYVHDKAFGQSNIHAALHAFQGKCQCQALDTHYAAKQVHKSLSNTIRSKVTVDVLEQVMIEQKLV